MDANEVERALIAKAIDDAFNAQMGKLFSNLTLQKPDDTHYMAFSMGLQIALQARRTIRLSLELTK